MDEATNALDLNTESHVLQEIRNIRKDRTIILITHRLSSVKDCDKIIHLENGEIKHEGNFTDLYSSVKNFELNK